jgi:hypothetical protein
MSTISIIYKIPNMVCSGVLTGIMLELLLPREDELFATSGRRLNRRYFIVGGICAATFLSYIRHDS